MRPNARLQRLQPRFRDCRRERFDPQLKIGNQHQRHCQTQDKLTRKRPRLTGQQPFDQHVYRNPDNDRDERDHNDAGRI